jgi:hypothetical protein
LDVAANGDSEGLVLLVSVRLPARAGVRYSAAIVPVVIVHNDGDSEIDTHTGVSVAGAPRDEVKQLVISGASLRVGPGDLDASGMKAGRQLNSNPICV